MSRWPKPQQTTSPCTPGRKFQPPATKVNFTNFGQKNEYLSSFTKKSRACRAPGAFSEVLAGGRPFGHEPLVWTRCTKLKHQEARILIILSRPASQWLLLQEKNRQPYDHLEKADRKMKKWFGTNIHFASIATIWQPGAKIDLFSPVWASQRHLAAGAPRASTGLARGSCCILS